MSIAKPRRIFYGWWIVVASVATALYVGGIVFYGFTAIFNPIVDDMHWSYTQVSIFASIRGLEEGIVAPFAGMFVDRFGPRKIVLVGGILSGAGLIMTSRVTSLAMFYGAGLIIAAGMSCCATTVLVTAVNAWFRRRAGLATGITVAGFGMGGIMIRVMEPLIVAYGWRSTMLRLGIGALCLIIPLSFVFRHKPEQYGLLPDGDMAADISVVETATHTVKTVEKELAFNKKDVLKSSVFWRIAISFMLYILLINALTSHIMPYLSSIGVDRSQASWIAAIIPLLSVPSRIYFGGLADKIDFRRILVICFIMVCVGLFLFGYMAAVGTGILVPFIILYGIGYDGVTPMRAYTTRKYLGTKNFGAIFGLVMLLSYCGTLMGPIVAARWHDVTGGYDNLWYLLAILPLISMGLLLSIRPAKNNPQIATNK